MRAYFQLFFGLLVPLSGLFILASVVYFKIEYNFIQALRLGVLSGFIIAIAVSLFTALSLLIMRRGKKPKKSILKRRKKVPVQTTQNLKTPAPTLKDNSNISTHGTTSTSPTISTDTKTIEQNMMLLMDRELAFEVALYAISDQNIGTLTESVTGAGHITVKNSDEVLQLTLTRLTRHTSQVVIESGLNSEAAKKIIRYMKEKEHSFLQY
jgi:hypothetical protein